MSRAFSPIQTRSLVDEVATNLTAAITQGRLAPGERIREVEVAQQMGISRGPVREALRLLEQQGLVVTRPRKGTFVREITVQEIDEIYGLRICLETYAMKEAIKRATDADVQRVAACHQEMWEAARRGDSGQLIETDLRLHRTICELAGNRRLLEVFDSLASGTRMVMTLIGSVYRDEKLIAQEHAPLVEALRSRDEARGEEEMRLHLTDAWQMVRARFMELLPGAGSPAAPTNEQGSDAGRSR